MALSAFYRFIKHCQTFQSRNHPFIPQPSFEFSQVSPHRIFRNGLQTPVKKLEKQLFRKNRKCLLKFSFCPQSVSEPLFLVIVRFHKGNQVTQPAAAKCYSNKLVQSLLRMASRLFRGIPQPAYLLTYHLGRKAGQNTFNQLLIFIGNPAIPIYPFQHLAVGIVFPIVFSL